MCTSKFHPQSKPWVKPDSGESWIANSRYPVVPGTHALAYIPIFCLVWRLAREEAGGALTQMTSHTSVGTHSL